MLNSEYLSFTHTRIPSHVDINVQLKPNIDIKPKFRCTDFSFFLQPSDFWVGLPSAPAAFLSSLAHLCLCRRTAALPSRRNWGFWSQCPNCEAHDYPLWIKSCWMVNRKEMRIIEKTFERGKENGSPLFRSNGSGNRIRYSTRVIAF